MMAGFDLQEEMLLALARGQGLQDMIKILSRFFQCPAVLIDASGRVLAALELPEGVEAGDFLAFSAAGVPKANTVATGIITTDGGLALPYWFLPLVQGELYGRLLLIKQQNPDQTTSALLMRVGLILIVELKKTRELQQMQLRYRDEFIHDLLYNNFDSAESLIQRGKTWGWDLARPHVLAVMEPDASKMETCESVLQKLAVLLDQSLALAWPAAVSAKRGAQIIILLPLEDQTMLSELKRLKAALASLWRGVKKEIYTQGGGSFSLGIGHVYNSAVNLYKSFQEAKSALELGRFFQPVDAVTYFDELGILSLLAKNGEQDLKDFCARFLNPLEEHDQKNGTQLVETLKAYFACQGNHLATAKQLYIHTNTLRYRLKKIEDVLGMSFDRLDVQLNLFAAIRLDAARGMWQT